MLNALRPTTTAVPDRLQAVPPGLAGDARMQSAASPDAVTLSRTAKSPLRPVPAAVAERLHQVGAKKAAGDTLSQSPDGRLTIDKVLNPLDQSSVVGEYVHGLAELSGTPKKTANWLWAVGKDLQDPSLSPTDRVVRLRGHTQATAKLLYTATALPAAWTGTTAILPAWLSAGRFATQASQCHRVLTGVMNVARPIGDAALFAGDAFFLMQKLQDPNASGGQIARAVVDVGLDTIRLAAYTTKNPTVTAISSAALWARTGLGLYDVWQHSKRS